MTIETQPAIPLPFQLSRLATSYWVPQALYVAPSSASPTRSATRRGRPPRSRVPSAPIPMRCDAAPLARAGRDRRLRRRRRGRFALTPLGTYLRSDGPDSVRAWVLLMGGPGVWDSWGRLVQCVRAGRSVPSLDGRDTWVEPTGDPDTSAVFNQSMVQLTRHLAPAIAVSYDFGPFRTIVEVGGGYGALLPPTLKANPELRGIVFDLPRCAEGARALIKRGVRLHRSGDPAEDRDAPLVVPVVDDDRDRRPRAHGGPSSGRSSSAPGCGLAASSRRRQR